VAERALAAMEVIGARLRDLHAPDARHAEVLRAWSRALHACHGQERRLSLYRGADDAPGGSGVGGGERDGASCLGAVLALTPGGGGGGGAAAHARHNLAEEELLLDWCLRETQAAPGPAPRVAEQPGPAPARRERLRGEDRDGCGSVWWGVGKRVGQP
jgi:hypothetical protein